jgi:hypothetical protein
MSNEVVGGVVAVMIAIFVVVVAVRSRRKVGDDSDS